MHAKASVTDNEATNRERDSMQIQTSDFQTRHCPSESDRELSQLTTVNYNVELHINTKLLLYYYSFRWRFGTSEIYCILAFNKVLLLITGHPLPVAGRRLDMDCDGCCDIKLTDSQKSDGNRNPTLLLEKQCVFVYNIPLEDKQKLKKLQRVAAAGWAVANPERDCKLTVITTDSGPQLRLIQKLQDDTEQIFGESIIQYYRGKFGPLSNLSSVLDSSRYFTLKITKVPSGETDFVGLGFSDNSDSSDLSKTVENYFANKKQLNNDGVNDGSGASKPMKINSKSRNNNNAQAEAQVVETEPPQKQKQSPTVNLSQTVADHETEVEFLGLKVGRGSAKQTKKRKKRKTGPVLVDLVSDDSDSSSDPGQNGNPTPRRKQKRSGPENSTKMPQSQEVQTVVDEDCVLVPHYKCPRCHVDISSDKTHLSQCLDTYLQNLQSKFDTVFNTINKLKNRSKKTSESGRINPTVTVGIETEDAVALNARLTARSIGQLNPEQVEQQTPVPVPVPEPFPLQVTSSPSETNRSPTPAAGSNDAETSKAPQIHLFRQPGNNRVVFCHLCPFVFKGSAGRHEPMLLHWQHVHELDAKNCICFTCSLLFPTEAETAEHMLFFHTY